MTQPKFRRRGRRPDKPAQKPASEAALAAYAAAAHRVLNLSGNRLAHFRAAHDERSGTVFYRGLIDYAADLAYELQLIDEDTDQVRDVDPDVADLHEIYDHAGYGGWDYVVAHLVGDRLQDNDFRELTDWGTDVLFHGGGARPQTTPAAPNRTTVAKAPARTASLEPDRRIPTKAQQARNRKIARYHRAYDLLRISLGVLFGGVCLLPVSTLAGWVFMARLSGAAAFLGLALLVYFASVRRVLRPQITTRANVEQRAAIHRAAGQQPATSTTTRKATRR